MFIGRGGRPRSKAITHSPSIFYLANFKLYTSLRFLIQISTKDVILYRINVAKPIVISKLIKVVISELDQSHKIFVVVVEVVYLQEINLIRLFIDSLGELDLFGFAGKKL